MNELCFPFYRQQFRIVQIETELLQTGSPDPDDGDIFWRHLRETHRHQRVIVIGRCDEEYPGCVVIQRIDDFIDDWSILVEIDVRILIG